MTEIAGVITANLTPFADDGSVDFAFIYRHLRFQEEHGIDGVAPCGTNGEGQSLSLEERKKIIRFVVENKGGMFVLAGTGCANLPETVELTMFAEQVGADAALVLPPYFYKPTHGGLLGYFRRLFDSVTIPIVLYNIPMLTGVEITHELLRDLSAYPHLLGVKDTSGDVECTKAYLQEFPRLKIFNGTDSLIVATLDAGAHGVVSGASNAFPGVISRLVGDHRAGRDASELQQLVSELRTLLARWPFAANKAALALQGFPVSHVRPPLVDMTIGETEALAEEIRRLGVA